MANLLNETLEVLDNLGIKEEEVVAEVNTDIIIYTVDYILYRHEYDGAERWEEIPTPEHMHELLSGKAPEIFSIDE